jgi:hypothetical protein
MMTLDESMGPWMQLRFVIILREEVKDAAAYFRTWSLT